jgi:hypothetical protein
MSLRDLLTFNLFLQFTDGLVSYQVLRAWGGRSQSCSGRCNSKLGYGLGTTLQQGFSVPTAAPDICAQTEPALNNNAGIVSNRLGVHVRHYCLCLGTPAIESLAIRLRHL